MGLVAGHRRAAPELGSDDTESHVRERRDSPGSATDRDRGGPMQNHEGKSLLVILLIYVSEPIHR